MNVISTQELFIAGETLSAKYLEYKGYEIVCTNFRSPYGEIDIIASDQDTLVFIEVKTRRKHSVKTSLLSLSATKQRHICLTAQYYINQNPDHGKLQTRFDLILAFYNEHLAEYSFEHMVNAFYPPQFT